MITAFILCYYPERLDHLPRIIKDLKNGIVPPDRIVVWNNSANKMDIKHVYGNGVEVIQSTQNLGHRVRFVAALTYASDYYFFLDDDTTANTHTIENYMKYANEDCCLTQWGKKVNPDSPPNKFYVSAKAYGGNTVKEPVDVDLVIGRGSIFTSFKALVNSLILEEEVRKWPEYNEGREADIILGMANKPQVVPAPVEAQMIDLGEKGVAMAKQPDHYILRSIVTHKIYEYKKGRT